MTILVCGGRLFRPTAQSYSTLADHLLPGTKLIHGGATGADAFADEFAKGLGFVEVVPYRITRAEWAQLGPAAGPIRNQRMLTEGKPDLVIAFPGGRGTADMVERAEAAGIPVIRAK